MVESRDNFFVLTGASGSGKSTLVSALIAQGHRCVEEMGRQLVQEQVRLGTGCTPWQDHPRFLELLLDRSIERFMSIGERERFVVFDRGIPECVGYARLLGIGVQEHHIQAVRQYRYNTTVFVTPPWREIYATDAERRHSFEESLDGHFAVLPAYREAGYKLVEVPKTSVENRVEFVLQNIRAAMVTKTGIGEGR